MVTEFKLSEAIQPALCGFAVNLEDSIFLCGVLNMYTWSLCTSQYLLCIFRVSENNLIQQLPGRHLT
jgi:hypothetical protein